MKFRLLRNLSRKMIVYYFEYNLSIRKTLSRLRKLLEAQQNDQNRIKNVLRNFYFYFNVKDLKKPRTNKTPHTI